jgi:predicted DNA-binding transcriptional regulator AlpA
MSKTESEWLGGAQLAALLGVTKMTLWRWQRDLQLAFPEPAIIHDRKYWRRDEIEKWMLSRKLPTTRLDHTTPGGLLPGGGAR